jgi:pimeloyl-ACP methyl ester carboxylesterase
MRIAAPNGISEAGYVKIGGIDQWIQIRGEDRANPVLLWLNGGPGFSTVPNTYAVRSWEKPFTIVMWDQRGEGETFARSGTSVAPTMTIDQMSRDGIEVAEYLRRHLRKDKIILLGHSWGSILGVHMVHARPDLFSAYVGTGQVVNLQKDAQAAYPLLLERARAVGNKSAEQQLAAVGPPPYPQASFANHTWVGWGNRLDPRTRPDVLLRSGSLWFVAQLLYQERALSPGATFSQDRMWGEIMSEDLPALGLRFEVPVVFIQGAEDRLTVTALTRDYFDRISAPSKQFVVLPGVGHLAIVFARGPFLRELVTYVRPLGNGDGPKRRGTEVPLSSLKSQSINPLWATSPGRSFQQ